MIKYFQTHIKYITKRGFKTGFNIIDNVKSKDIKVYLQEDNTIMQFVEPHNHLFNAVVREIQAFKIISLLDSA